MAMKPTGKSSVSASADPRIHSNQSHVVASKPNGKSPVSSFNDHEVMLFKDVSLGPHESELRFRLIHFWEARNPIKKTFIGLEMLLIDEQNSELSALWDSPVAFVEDRFRFHTYEDFESNCELRGDLYGTFALTSMSSSRVFIDHDVPPTRDYLTWLSSNPEIAKKVNAEVVTKPETLTIAEIFSYIDQPDAKDALFECTSTIDDVVHGSAWYYIGCGGCKTKAIKGPTSLMFPKCEKDDIAGEAQYEL
ncbi:hypothetical protein N665_0901s0007 [Sinapis alba]|nr:hypothetical protein N665_0901s0007 [Sinapis alba]